MTAKKFGSILIAGVVLVMLAILPNTSYGQDRDTILVNYGNINATPINVAINQRVTVGVYVNTGDSAWVADCHFCLGTADQYIDSILSSTEGQLFYPLTEWEFAAFSDPFTSPPNPEGWSAQALFGWARINPNGDAPWLHTTTLTHIADFKYKLDNNNINIGDDTWAIGRGLSPFQGPSNAGDTLGGLGYVINEHYSQFHFTGGGYIEGIVSNSSGTPIVGASIVNTATGKITTTDATGFYHMGLYPGTHSFTYSHPDYISRDTTGILIQLNQTRTVNFRLQMLGAIGGTITNYEGNPIQNATVTVSGHSVNTGADGHYLITELAAGTYSVVFVHVDYVDSVIAGVVVVLDQTTTLNYMMNRLGGITGIVTDADVGTFIEGVVVHLWPGNTTRTTNNVGVYTFANLNSDTYDSLVFAHPDFRDTTAYDIVVGYNINTQVDIGMEFGVGIDDGYSSMPLEYSVKQNYPNPFNASTTIEYGLPEAGRVTIEIYDVLGRQVATLVDEYQSAGYHQAIWKAGSQTSGMYFFRIQANDYVDQKSMMLLK